MDLVFHMPSNRSVALAPTLEEAALQLLTETELQQYCTGKLKIGWNQVKDESQMLALADPQPRSA